MILRSLVSGIICYGIFMCVQSTIPEALAIKRSSGIQEYVIGEQRNRRQQNFVKKEMALDNDLFDNVDNVGLSYKTRSLGANKIGEGSKELPALIVDYANMIRNDIILLDNSVETRTSKRGNVKVEKFNQAIPDVPCSCNSNKEVVDLGENCYPRYIESRNCSNEMCVPPYKCQPNMYELTVLKRRSSAFEHSLIEIPSDLRHRWVAKNQSVTIGCMCTRNYIIDN